MNFRNAMPLILAIGACTFSPVRAAFADDAPVTLRYVDKVGDTQRQQVLIKASVQGLEAIMKTVHKTAVKDVKDTGEVTLLETDEGGTLTLMGNDQHQDPTPDITVKRDKTGKITSWKPAMDINGALTPEILQTTEQFYSLIFPTTPVKTKDTWKLELDNPMFKDKKIKLENTFLGIEKVDGVDLWKVKQSATVPTDADGGVATFEGTFFLNPDNGHTVKLEGNVKDVPSQFGKLSFVVTVTPVKDGDAAKGATPDKAAQPK